jgi:hypothetical protein
MKVEDHVDILSAVLIEKVLPLTQYRSSASTFDEILHTKNQQLMMRTHIHKKFWYKNSLCVLECRKGSHLSLLELPLRTNLSKGKFLSPNS